MITPEDRRFLKQWMEQREGGKKSYLLHFVLVGAFIFTLIISVITFLFFQVVFGTWLFWLILGIGFLGSYLLVLLSWNKNEKRFKVLVQRLKEYLEAKKEEDGGC